MTSRQTDKPELHCTIVYHGPAGAGKTSNLTYLHQYAPVLALPDFRREIDQEKHKAVLSLDFIPSPPIRIRGALSHMHLITMPGPVLDKDWWKDLLRNADGVVFVADSVTDKFQECIDKYHDLIDFLTMLNRDVTTFPGVIQYNKRDLPEKRLVPVSTMQQHINRLHWPHFESSLPSKERYTIPHEGSYGAQETFEAITTQVVARLAQSQ